MQPLVAALLTDVLCALAAHRWFNTFEPTANATFFLILAALPSVAVALLISESRSLLRAICVAYPVFYGTLLSSIVAYRVSRFHPLAKYPGPLLCKVSQLWTVWITSRGQLHVYHKELHDRYGSIVRIGPNEISIVDKDLIPSILGPQGMPKGPLWEGRDIITPKYGNELTNVIVSRDMHEHAQLRKPWSKAFGKLPMMDYEESLIKRVSQFMGELLRICEEDENGIARVNISKWIDYFSFDFMGDMAFGGGLEIMRGDDKHGVFHSMEAVLYLLGLLQHVPWFAPIVRSLPFGNGSARVFGAFAVQCAQIRASSDVQKKDLFYYFLEASGSDSLPSPFPLIVSNAVLAIVAGSDTTASVLSNIVYYLLANPGAYARLREEIDDAFPPTEEAPLNTAKLPSLEFLNAVINETLRLQPAVPTGLQRAPAAGSGGKMIGTHFVKEGTSVQVPPYVMHRDPRYFSPDPDRFWPERWLAHDPTREDKARGNIVLERDAFIPFSCGPANCAGKPLAILEMRCVVALFMMRFDMAFDDGYDPARWGEGLRDCLVLMRGELPIKLTARKRVGVDYLDDPCHAMPSA